MKKDMTDDQIIEDCKQFRKARFQFHIKQKEWVNMSKKTKKALIGAFKVIAELRLKKEGQNE